MSCLRVVRVEVETLDPLKYLTGLHVYIAIRQVKVQCMYYVLHYMTMHVMAECL